MKKVSAVALWLLCGACLSAQMFPDLVELPLGTGGNRVWLLPGNVSGDPLVITGELEIEDVAPRLVRFFDESRGMEPEEVASVLREGGFVPTGGRVSWGKQDAACWFAFDFVADISGPKDLNLEVLITGFPVTVSPGERGTFLVYLDYPAGILSHARLFSRDAYERRSTTRVALNAMLMGVNLSLILYNLFIFIWTRDRVFLAFALFLLSFTLYLYMREDYINNLFPYFRDYYFSAPALAFAAFFAQFFFNTRKEAPIAHGFLAVFFWGFWGFFVIRVIFRFNSAAVQLGWSLFQMALVFYAVGLGVLMSVRKPKTGVYYLISWLPLVAANMILQFQELAILQTNTPFLFFCVREGLYTAGAIQAVLLSITLADKINFFKAGEAMARREKEGLEALDRMKTNFVMNVSHEFRTPLTLMAGVTENAAGGIYGEAVPRSHEMFRILDRNIHRLLGLVNNLLATSRLESMTHRADPVPVDLSGYLRFLVSEFQAVADRDGITLSLSVSPAAEPVIVDAEIGLLEIVFLNILSNAFKFTPDGGNIGIEVEVRDETVIAAVRDSGPGIAPDKLERIFQRFYQLEIGARQHEGAGIGLSLVREATTLLGGAVEAKNDPEGGSVFTVRLPLSARGVPALKTGTSALPADYSPASVRSVIAGFGEKAVTNIGEQPADGSRTGLLVVEDNRDLQEFLKNELQQDFTVHTAANGKDALEVLVGGLDVNLVISDIMMPEMDGRQLFRRVRDLGLGHIPFLFLTARASEEEKTETLEEGAVDYLCKPFSRRELVAKVHNIVRQNAASRELYRRNLKQRVLRVFDQDSAPGPAPIFGGEREIRLSALGLSNREREVTTLVLNGLCDKEIAVQLGIAVSTASNTLGRVYRKLRVGGRVELIRKLSAEGR